MPGHYKSNVRDLIFTTLEWSSTREQLGTGLFEEFDERSVTDMITEAAKLAEGPLAQTFALADREPPVFDPATNSVTLPEAFRKSFELLRSSEWWRLDTDPALGGQLAPRTVVWPIVELLTGANPTLQMYISGPIFASMIRRNGTEPQRRLAELIVERGWSTTMVLTEPDAGSDVGSIRTHATPMADGSWQLEGVKRFISGGEHDLSENIVHLVLARPRGAGPGTKGLSLFVVPKFHFDPETGELGARNGVFATGLEHKMGLKGSATCELSFGEDAARPAVGWLLGDQHRGIVQMFQLIQYTRMSVGGKSIATLSTGYLNALEFALTRVQSADLTRSADAAADRVAIIRHPDVRRTLMLGKAYSEGLRALVSYAASVQDRIALAHHDSRDTAEDDALNQLLLPIVKGVGAERSYEQLGHLLQIFGGSGYLRDYPLEQYIRDTRIDAIYEGTTAIQGQDLFFRRIARDRGVVFGRLRAEILDFADSVTAESLTAPVKSLREAVAQVDAMVKELRKVEELSRSGAIEEVYRVGQNTTILLLSLGDLLVGYLLTQQAEVALRGLDRERLSEADRAFYQGKVAVATFFASTVLPELASRAHIVGSTDGSLMSVEDTSF